MAAFDITVNKISFLRSSKPINKKIDEEKRDVMNVLSWSGSKVEITCGRTFLSGYIVGRNSESYSLLSDSGIKGKDVGFYNLSHETPHGKFPFSK